MVTPAVFATMWKLTTTEESNDQGSWNNYQVEKVSLVNNRDMLQEAMAFRKSIAAGEVKAAAEEHGNSSPCLHNRMMTSRFKQLVVCFRSGFSTPRFH
jgi:hypothetical protein